MSKRRKFNKEWKNINWKDVEKYIPRLQKNIFKVRKEQRLILNLTNAKLLAVRKCKQDNQGKDTVGVHGIKTVSLQERTKLALSLKLKGKASLVRRVMIFKPNGKKRETQKNVKINFIPLMFWK